jgi:hypothetical protein
MQYILPFYKDKYNYKYNIVLENVRYYLTFQYNSRMDRWIMNVSNYKQEPILSGIPILLGADLIRRFVTEEKPSGFLFFYNPVNKYVEAGRDTISDDYVLFYADSDDEDYLEAISG